MSRLWDTPEYWVRSEADEMPESEPGTVADSFERSAANYDGDPGFAAAVVAELRRRAAAGVRFWRGPLPAADAAQGSGSNDIADLIDDEIPW